MMQNGNTRLERLIMWLCGPAGSPTLDGEGLKPTLRWVRTGRSKDARRLTALDRLRLADPPTPPISHGLWILTCVPHVFGVDALYALLAQLLFLAALADSEGRVRS